MCLTLFLARKERDARSSENCTECVSPVLPWGYGEDMCGTLSALVPPHPPPAAVFAAHTGSETGSFQSFEVLGPLHLPSNRLLLSLLHLPVGALENSIWFPLMADLFERSERAAVNYYIAPYLLSRSKECSWFWSNGGRTAEFPEDFFFFLCGLDPPSLALFLPFLASVKPSAPSGNVPPAEVGRCWARSEDALAFGCSWWH